MMTDDQATPNETIRQLFVDGDIPVKTSAINAPTVYADGVWFCIRQGSVVKIQFIENIADPTNSIDPGIKARHVGTLALPMEGFASMVSYLNGMLTGFLAESAETTSTAHG